MNAPAGSGEGPPATLAALPRDLSPWGMFLAADIVAKIVMGGLAAVSVLTWTVAIAEISELGGERRRVAGARAALTGGMRFTDTAAVLEARGGVPAMVAAAAAEELAQSDGLPSDGVKDRIALALSQSVAVTIRRLRRGAGSLATIGATAPFVGLFGTVWGIMNSFIGISRAQTTNLAVVAPGIAGALLATALGLFAAIPAVVIYNATTRRIADHRAALEDLSNDLLRLAGRDTTSSTAPMAFCSHRWRRGWRLRADHDGPAAPDTPGGAGARGGCDARVSSARLSARPWRVASRAAITIRSM
ncbi:biopolymer transport protein ExbB [Rhodoplanes tepidamans]|nr:biopolymer transport protein ExbB [Rhodoplanes tepidamans]